MAGRDGNWSVTTLKDCADWYSGGTPSTSVAEYWNGDIPWITASSLHDFYIKGSERRVTSLGVANGTRLMPKDTILFVVRGMSLKTEFRVGITRRPMAFGQDCKALVAKDGVDPLFLANVLRAKAEEILGFVDEASHGTGRLATDAIQKLEIPLPPLAEQKAIAHILGTLDDKIELNQQMNQTMEAISRTLFKSWFIDFDPVRAKMDGRQPAGMDAETAALFPDEFDDSAIDKIPKGWRAGFLGDVCLAQGGFAYKSKDFTDTGYPVIKIKNINGDTTVDVDDVQYISEPIALKTKNFWLNDGDLIMAMTGATVGKFGIVLNKDLPCLLNQRVAKLIPLEGQGNSNGFIHFALLQTDLADQVFSIAEGSAQPNISANGIMKTQLVIPTNLLIKSFNNKVDSILCKILANRIESRTLASIRDALLPKLLSGEIHVKDAEKIVEAVA